MQRIFAERRDLQWLVAVQCSQFLPFVFQGGAVGSCFCTNVQQFQIDFIGFQNIGISCFQTFLVIGGKFFCLFQTFVQQPLLLLQHEDVEAYFLGLKQQLLAESGGLCIECTGFKTVHLSTRSVERREVEAL